MFDIWEAISSTVSMDRTESDAFFHFLPDDFYTFTAYYYWFVITYIVYANKNAQTGCDETHYRVSRCCDRTS